MRFLSIHAFGNLVAFMFISMHVASQLSRTAPFAPDFGTGIILFLLVLIQVMSGMLIKLNILRSYYKQRRLIHVAVAYFFYVFIFSHILKVLGII